MEATWSSCWTVTSTCPGVWESVCLWTLPAGFTTCTARASSTGTSPPRYSVLVLLLALRWPVSHFYFHGERWNSPSPLRCWVIQKIESVIVSPCPHVFWWPPFCAELSGPLWKRHIHCCGGRLWPGWKDPWLQVSVTRRPVLSLSQPPRKNYVDKAWCHSDVIQPENTVSCSAATRLGSFFKSSDAKCLFIPALL